jgi:hypothetical protein
MLTYANPMLTLCHCRLADHVMIPALDVWQWCMARHWRPSGTLHVEPPLPPPPPPPPPLSPAPAGAVRLDDMGAATPRITIRTAEQTQRNDNRGADVGDVEVDAEAAWWGGGGERVDGQVGSTARSRVVVLVEGAGGGGLGTDVSAGSQGGSPPTDGGVRNVQMDVALIIDMLAEVLCPPPVYEKPSHKPHPCAHATYMQR